MTNEEAVFEIQSNFDVNHVFAHHLASRSRISSLLEDASILISEKPKPFVKWVGGKRQLLAQFKENNLYPPKGFNPETGRYFEPFTGGGAVFFDLLPKKAVLSDMNKELVTTYFVIRDNVELLIESLRQHQVNKEYFLDIRAKNPSELSDVEIASRFIYLNRTCFNGMYRVNKSGGFNVPYGKAANPTICDDVNLKRVSHALKNVEIHHRDYKLVLDEARKGDFIYFDPPYYPLSDTSSFTSYTAEGFLKKEQEELRDLVLELDKKGCYVMLSNSDAPFINEIYSGHQNIRIEKVMAGRAINSKASGRGKITEVLIVNY